MKADKEGIHLAASDAHNVAIFHNDRHMPIHTDDRLVAGMNAYGDLCAFCQNDGLVRGKVGSNRHNQNIAQFWWKDGAARCERVGG